MPSTTTYETNIDVRSLRYSAIIQAKDENGAAMQTKIAFYYAGKFIGEKVFTIEGKGSEVAVIYHDEYNLFETDLQQPL